MDRVDPLRARLGALALGLSALLLAVFPLLLSFFPLDVFDGEATLRAASPALASWPWNSGARSSRARCASPTAC